MIIGLTGKNGSGKGEVARFLRERGFEYLSLSDVIRRELVKRKKRLTRENLVAQGNELRKKFGPDVLAKRTVEQMEMEKNYVVDSIRHPAEAKALKAHNGFALLNVTAPPKVRFERLRARGRENDPRTFGEFKKLERTEGGSSVRSDQQLDRTIGLADYSVRNAGTLKELEDEVTRIVMAIARKKKTPELGRIFFRHCKSRRAQVQLRQAKSSRRHRQR